MKQEEILHKEFFYKGLEIRGIDWYNNEKKCRGGVLPRITGYLRPWRIPL